MVESIIRLERLNLEELSGVVNLYPWYAGARKELCRRMAELGEGAWSDERYADAALYFGSRKIAAALAHGSYRSDCADVDASRILRSCFGPAAPREEETSSEAAGTPAPESQGRQIFVVGGDYFSQSDYNGVRRSDDNIFSSFATKARSEAKYEETSDMDVTDFCTETLAEIYLEQGYYEQAQTIYSKLSLRYPEKSVYFAALIDKIKRNNI